jgi:phage N-6-adenine-methyltransferase
MGRQNSTELKDVWQTPDAILDPITETIDLDPAAAPDTNIGERNLTEDDDGLSSEWEGTIFVNPPFSEKKDWLAKCVEEHEAGNTDTIYFVTPDSTDTQSWWHEYIAPHADYILFFHGRQGYIDPDTGKVEIYVTFGTAMSIYGEPPRETLEALNEEGHLVEAVSFK